MKLVYVAGKFTGVTRLEVKANVLAAEVLAARIALRGAMPIVVHSLGETMLGTCGDEEFWYEGTMEVLRRCDAIALVHNWEESIGARKERAWSLQHVPVFEASDVEGEGFARWAKGEGPSWRPPRPTL